MTRVRILKVVWQRGRLLIRIFIVDDHQHFRAKLRALLEAVEAWEVCGEAENGCEAIEKHSSTQPHVTVMDFHMPELNGLHTSRAILRKCPDAPILLLTLFGSPQLIVQARKEGIKGFCCKTQTECITIAIESLLRGETYFPESLSASAGD